VARRLRQVVQAQPVKAIPVSRPDTAQLPWYLTLRFQFSAFTAGLITVIMIIVGFAAFWQSTKALNEEIEKNGVRLVNEVARLGRRFLIQLSSDIPEPYDEIQARYQQEMRERFGEKTAKDVVSAIVKADEESPVPANRRAIASSEAKPKQMSLLPAHKFGGDPSIEISSGTASFIDKKGEIAVRVFEKKIPTDEDVKWGGIAYITLSASNISKAQHILLVRLLAIFVIAVLMGIGTSYLLANQITAPITQLVSDFEIVSQGNLEHRTQSKSSNEIGYLARQFDDMTVKLRAMQRAEIAYKAREHELKVATAIQESLLPKDVPQVAGYDIDAYYRPSREVGGDYYDFIKIDENQLGIVVADVSGKGIPASMVMAMARSVMRAAAHAHQSASEVLKEVNHIMAEDLRKGTFVTALYMLLRHKDKELFCSSAGHNPFVLYSGATKKCRLIRPRGIALGFDRGPIFNNTIEEEAIKISPGDRIVAYTDGVVEARSPNGEQFGDERLMNLVASADSMNAKAFINMLADEVARHEGPNMQHDDITIATFTVL
jgi:serine phosphatase RsbU (regulator of sigma subunit)